MSETQSNLIFIVDDDPLIRNLLDHTIRSRWGYRTRLFSGKNEQLWKPDEIPELIILDIMLGDSNGMDVLKKIKDHQPDIPVLMLSSQTDVAVAIETMRLGAMDYFTKPVDVQRLEFSIKNALGLSQLKSHVRQLQESLESSVSFDNIITQSGAMNDVLRLVSKARNSLITVLIEGESGTGKELIARAIHFNGNRKDQPFVVMNCAAIPRDLLESELFGHERGSFTGAVQQKIGKFEMAHNGTLFLDEIGELDIGLQAKLLRIIQEKRFERVGGTDVIECDVRIVSATNRNLRIAVNEKVFREDLYYRLSEFPISLPPLRNRPGDIRLLAEYFLKKFSEKESKGTLRFSPAALKTLEQHRWPGNVRELQATIQRAVLLSESDTVSEFFPPLLGTASGLQSEENAKVVCFASKEEIIPMEAIREAAIREALRITDNNISEASQALEIGRTTMYDLMKKFGISADK